VGRRWHVGKAWLSVGVVEMACVVDYVGEIPALNSPLDGRAQGCAPRRQDAGVDDRETPARGQDDDVVVDSRPI